MEEHSSWLPKDFLISPYSFLSTQIVFSLERKRRSKFKTMESERPKSGYQNFRMIASVYQSSDPLENTI